MPELRPVSDDDASPEVRRATHAAIHGLASTRHTFNLAAPQLDGELA
jgi:hypothetical protein